MDKLREECGIFGIISDKPLPSASITATALISLQHRGQEGTGICLFADGKMVCKKGIGLVSEIFDSNFLTSAPDAQIAVGHVRYSTTGRNSIENTQPIVIQHSKLSFALSHNGNITNAAKLREAIVSKGGVIHTTNDSEIIGILIVEQLVKNISIEKAVLNVMNIIEGAFSLVIGTADKLIAARDKNGFRPLCMGKFSDATVFASESCALDSINAEIVRDINPGEIVVVTQNNQIETIQCDTCGCKRGLCVFEFVYFARPDSIIDGISVYQARLEMGRRLYRQMPTEADIVCGVPDSGFEAAYGFAMESGIPYGTAFVKNRYVGRSFIAPTQAKRESVVRYKLNPLKASISGKRVILVDDSIVRGTTSKNIIKLLRDAGAKEVHLRVSSPPFRYPCYFGTDVDSRENLIANFYTVDEIAKKIGADSLAYLDEKEILTINFGKDIEYCGGCFSGKYPIFVEPTQKDKFEA